jgi:hypothetical protein
MGPPVRYRSTYFKTCSGELVSVGGLSKECKNCGDMGRDWDWSDAGIQVMHSTNAYGDDDTYVNIPITAGIMGFEGALDLVAPIGDVEAIVGGA